MLLCLACLAITSFAAFPDSLSIGAVFATSLNALTVGYCYYLTMEFMTHGWRDPYYYAFSGWIVYFVTRAFARIVLSNITPLNSNTELTLAIMADAVVASALIIFVRFLNDAKTPAPGIARRSDIAASKSRGPEQPGGAKRHRLVAGGFVCRGHCGAQEAVPAFGA